MKQHSNMLRVFVQSASSKQHKSPSSSVIWLQSRGPVCTAILSFIRVLASPCMKPGPPLTSWGMLMESSWLLPGTFTSTTVTSQRSVSCCAVSWSSFSGPPLTLSWTRSDSLYFTIFSHADIAGECLDGPLSWFKRDLNTLFYFVNLGFWVK